MGERGATARRNPSRRPRSSTSPGKSVPQPVTGSRPPDTGTGPSLQLRKSPGQTRRSPLHPPRAAAKLAARSPRPLRLCPRPVRLGRIGRIHQIGIVEMKFQPPHPHRRLYRIFMPCENRNHGFDVGASCPLQQHCRLGISKYDDGRMGLHRHASNPTPSPSPSPSRTPTRIHTHTRSRAQPNARVGA